MKKCLNVINLATPIIKSEKKYSKPKTNKIYRLKRYQINVFS